MESVPTEAENPEGLHGRYIVTKANGDPVDPDAFYFVLRIDSGGSDPRHLTACHNAIMTYCEHIEDHIPQLANDLRRRVIQERSALALDRQAFHQDRDTR